MTADFSTTLNDKPGDDLELDLEPINGTTDFRVNITLDLGGKPWYDDRKEQYRCVRPAKCEKLQNSTCFGSKIQYKYTSVQLTDEGSQESSLKKLYQLEAFRNIPECWAVIQVRISLPLFSQTVWISGVHLSFVHFFSHFYVLYTCQNAHEARIASMFICHL